MPILYLHGVNVRSRVGFATFEPFARRYLAPVISEEPESVTIRDVFWGDLAFDPAFGGTSRPRSRIFGMGVQGAADADAQIAALLGDTPQLDATLARHFENSDDQAPVSGGLSGSGLAGGIPDIAAGGRGKIDWSAEIATLLALDDDTLSDVLAVMVRGSADFAADSADLQGAAASEPGETANATKEARLVLAADALVSDGTARSILASPGPAEDIFRKLFAKIEQRAADDAGLGSMGIGDWVARTSDRIGEAATRVGSLKGYLISSVLAEARAPLNALVSRFLGDVFVYLKSRGTAGAPGAIQQALLTELKGLDKIKVDRNGERIVVVSHSMGGQLMYDALTHYLPGDPDLAGIKVDFWCAAASQVGFFEEGKLFHASKTAHRTGNPVPFPKDNLGHWWNVWDHNDFLSFTVKDIIDGVDDEAYSSGTSLLAAHGAYLQTPSFYRKMAARIGAASPGVA